MRRSFLSFLVLVAASGLMACGRGTQAAAKGTGARIEVAVTAAGFVPAATRVKVGQPVTLVVTRKVERTCATDIVIGEYGIKKALPLGQPVEVAFVPTKPGKIHFSCAMDMIAGDLVAD